MHALLTTSFSAVFSMHIYYTCVLCGALIRLEISWENIQTPLHRGMSSCHELICLLVLTGANLALRAHSWSAEALGHFHSYMGPEDEEHDSNSQAC